MRHLLDGPSSEPTIAGRWFWHDFAAALLCVAAALLVRWSCANHGLTTDELWHLAVSTGRANEFIQWPDDQLVAAPTSMTSITFAAPLRSVWAPMRSVLHPPLYTFSLRLWRDALGGGDWVAAMYSAVWSIAAILFVFAAVRLQAGVGLATLVGVAMALSPVQAHLGTEVRGYAMMMGLSAFALWQMVRIEANGATVGRAWLLGLTLCPLLLTHYFAFGTCVAVGMWGAVHLRGPIRLQFMTSIALAAAVFMLLWLPQAVAQIKDMHAGDDFLTTDSPFWRNSLLSGIAMPLRLFAYVSTRKVAMAGSIGLLAVTMAGVSRRPALSPWLLMLSMPIVTLLTLDALRGTQHTFFIRYAAAAAVAVPAAPVLAAAALRPAAGWCLGLMFVTLAAAGLGAPRELGSPAFHHMPKAFLPVISAGPADAPLVALGRPISKQWWGRALLLEWSHIPGFFPRPTMLLANPRPAEIERLREAAPGGRVWLVTSGEPPDETGMSERLHALLPTARLVQPPLTVPLGGGRFTPQPPVELRLLELDAPTAAER